jgi:hypothetical protein
MSQFEGAPNISFVAISIVVSLYAASLVQKVLYNLYRHPLAHVPGPKLAGATYLYQTYFSFRSGKSRYYIQVAQLHKKYGEIGTPHIDQKPTLMDCQAPWCESLPMKST